MSYVVGPVELGGIGPVLAQYDPDVRWNGWLCPRLDACSVVVILDAIIASSPSDPPFAYEFIQGVLFVDDMYDQTLPTDWYEPDEDGLYALGSHAWIWQASRRREPLGIFRAVSTRDAEALSRDGQPYFDMHRLDESLPDEDRTRILMARGGELYEVQFGDGTWMLVRAEDLTAGVIRPR